LRDIAANVASEKAEPQNELLSGTTLLHLISN
jgi:hypothetical protein